MGNCLTEVAICKVPLCGVWYKKRPYFISQCQVFKVKRCNQFGKYLIGFRNGNTGNIGKIYISDEQFHEYFDYNWTITPCVDCSRLIFFEKGGKCSDPVLDNNPWLCQKYCQIRNRCHLPPIKSRK